MGVGDACPSSSERSAAGCLLDGQLRFLAPGDGDAEGGLLRVVLLLADPPSGEQPGGSSNLGFRQPLL